MVACHSLLQTHCWLTIVHSNKRIHYQDESEDKMKNKTYYEFQNNLSTSSDTKLSVCLNKIAQVARCAYDIMNIKIIDQVGGKPKITPR